MPVQFQFSPLHRLVIIVARGHVMQDDVKHVVEQMTGAGVRHYGKIIDVSEANDEMTVEQIERFAAALRGPAGASVLRGPIAFVVDPNRRGFADNFADATEEDRPVKLFRSLHDARRWLQQVMDEERPGGAGRTSPPRTQAPPT